MSQLKTIDPISSLLDEINLEIKTTISEVYKDLSIDDVILYCVATAKQREYTKNHQKNTRKKMQALEKRLRELGEEIPE